VRTPPGSISDTDRPRRYLWCYVMLSLYCVMLPVLRRAVQGELHVLFRAQLCVMHVLQNAIIVLYDAVIMLSIRYSQMVCLR
jgi:hypothetical protein